MFSFCDMIQCTVKDWMVWLEMEEGQKKKKKGK